MADANSISNSGIKQKEALQEELGKKAWSAHAFVVAANLLLERIEDKHPEQDVCSLVYLLQDTAEKLQDLALELSEANFSL